MHVKLANFLNEVGEPVRYECLDNAPTKKFVCPNLCGSSFSHNYSLTRHLKYECGQEPRFKCPYCDLHYKRTSNVTQHIRTRHVNCTTYAIDIIDNKIVGIHFTEKKKF
ncbi:Similar to lola: Longitudinals lacking protein [Cotesia congregata]|uniref:Isoforms A/B/D/L (Drosophila melanogaster) n=1 Tax=Cotesia congregata TaxID=51543 RepID=A0A8J2MNH0_COTCN|nr:Similar to lola: Longitudinals lacking protein [Cotesia congregata]